MISYNNLSGINSLVDNTFMLKWKVLDSDPNVKTSIQMKVHLTGKSQVNYSN